MSYRHTELSSKFNLGFKTFFKVLPPFPGPKYDLDLQDSKVSESLDFLFSKEFKFLRHAKINVKKMSVTHAKENMYFLQKI